MPECLTVQRAIAAAESGETEIELKRVRLTTTNLRPLLQALETNRTVTKLRFSRITKLGDDGAALVADMLGHNGSITDISLSSNKIGEAGMKALAESLQANNGILTLDLGGNEFGATGAEAFAESLKLNSSIKELDLEGTKLGDDGAVALAEGLKLNSSILILRLGHNQIGAAGAAALAKSLKHNSSVEELHLSNNKIGDAGAAALAEMLDVNSSIKVLNLQDNKFGATGAEALAGGLKHNSSVKELDLWGNEIGDAGAVALAEMLALNSSIKVLTLGDTKVGDAGAEALAEGLKLNNGILTLDLRENKIGDAGAEALVEVLNLKSTIKIPLGDNAIGDAGAMAFAAMLTLDSSIKELDLGNNKIGEAGAKALAELLKLNSIESLDLYDNEIGDVGAEALAEGLKLSSSILTLDLGSNNIGGDGAAALAESLKLDSSSVEKLVLTSNKFGDAGAGALAEMIKINSSITELELWQNEIGDAGAVALAEGLGLNSSILTLHLGSIKIGPDGAASLAEGLKVNSSIEELRLSYTSIGDAGVVALAEMLKLNVSITTLHFERNGVGPAGATALAESLKLNTSVKKLALDSNNIGDAGAKALAEMLGLDSSSIETLNLWRNNIGDAGAEALVEMAKTNSSLMDFRVGYTWDSNDTQIGDTALQLFDSLFGPMETGRTPDDEPIYRVLTTEERLDVLVHTLFDTDDFSFADMAWTMAGKNPDTFVAFVSWLREAERLPAHLFETGAFWLQERTGEQPIPMAHFLLDQKGANAVRFCEEFITDALPLDEGLALMRGEDQAGRSLRSLASAHANTQGWSRRFGTYLGRYDIVVGPAVHSSKTCSVHYATDVVKNKEVAVKIMREEDQYKREIEARKALERLGDTSGVVELLWPTDDDAACEEQEADLCLVMPRGSRSLFEAVNTERFAGRDFGKIKRIAKELASALQALHVSGHVHGDVKPRNAVRVAATPNTTFADGDGGRYKVSEAWKEQGTNNDSGTGDAADLEEEWRLIDLDASVAIDAPLSDKASTGYVAPELARAHFGGEERPRAATSADVWSFGVVLFQLLSGTKLFLVDETDDNLVERRDEQELMNWLCIDSGRMQRIEKAGREYRWNADKISAAQDVVRVCLRGDPAERMSLERLLETHPFFVDDYDADVDAVDVVDADPDTDTALVVAAAAAAKSTAVQRRSSRGSSRGDGRRTSRGGGRGGGRSGGRGGGGGRRATARQRLSRRITSIHRGLFSGPWGRFRSKEGRAMSSADVYAVSQLREEALRMPQYHFFLSYAQAEAAGTANDMHHTLAASRCWSWLDLFSDDLTADGMRRGVEASRNFLVVLTENVLFRPFCLLELVWAKGHFGRHGAAWQERVVFLREDEARFASWDAATDAPWLVDDDTGDEDWVVEMKLERAEAHVAMDRSRADAHRLQESSLAAKLLKRRLDLRRLRAGLARNGLDADEAIGVAREALGGCLQLPYRRRPYEKVAMVQRLLGHCDIQHARPRATPPDFAGAPSESEVAVFVLHADGNDAVARQVHEAISEDPDARSARGATRFQPQLMTASAFERWARATPATTALVVVLENGLFAGTAALGPALEAWCGCGGAPRPFVVVQSGWAFDGPEQKGLAPLLQDALFDNTEIMPFRDPAAGEYETAAMRDEVKRRLHVALPTVPRP